MPGAGNSIQMEEMFCQRSCSVFHLQGEAWNHIKGLCPFASHNLLPGQRLRSLVSWVRHILEQRGSF